MAYLMKFINIDIMVPFPDSLGYPFLCVGEF